MPFEKVLRSNSKSSLLKRRSSTASLYSNHETSEIIDRVQLDEIYNRIVGNSSVIIPETGETSHRHYFNLISGGGSSTENFAQSGNLSNSDAILSELENSDYEQPNSNSALFSGTSSPFARYGNYPSNDYFGSELPYGSQGNLSFGQRVSYSLERRVTNFSGMLKDLCATYCSKDILKCSIAYFIASLGVYWTSVGKILGNSDNKHLVATVAVYFHPSRSIGSMHQSILFIMISLLYSFLVSIVCAIISSFMYNHGEDEISYLVNVTVIAIALSVVSVLKQKVNKQTFNVACSLASTSMISSIVKEGSRKAGSIPIDRLNSVFRIVVFGALISIVLCYVLWPESSNEAIKQNLNESYYLMSDLLSLLSDKFLTGKDTHEVAVVKTQEQLKKNVKKLKSILEETKFELCVLGKEHEYKILAKLVNSTVLLNRYLAGLKNSSDLQWKLLHEYELNQQRKSILVQNNVDRGANASQQSGDSQSSTSKAALLAPKKAGAGRNGTASIYGSRTASTMRSSFGAIEEVDKESEDEADHHDKPLNHDNIQSDNDGDNEEDITDPADIITATQLFNIFIYNLGPPLKSFSFTLREILDNIPFDNNKPFAVTGSAVQFFRSLQKAQNLFNRKQLEAMEKLYDEKLFKLVKGKELKADEEEVAASCFNFAYSLTEYSNELNKVLLLLEDYAATQENDTRSFEWLKFWKRLQFKRSKYTSLQSEENQRRSSSASLHSIKNDHVQEDQRPKLEIFKNVTHSSQKAAVVSSSIDYAPSQTLDNAEQSNFNTEGSQNFSSPGNATKGNSSFTSKLTAKKEEFRYKLWKFFSYFRRSDIQFGIRVGIGAFVLSSIAFFPKTKEFFANWRLEWALVIYSIMMNKSMGGTQMTVKWRIIGTFLGSSIAVLTWKLFSGEAWALAIVGFLISIPSFHIILKWSSFNAYGRFILLTYNLTALYSYSMTLDEEEDDREGGNSPIIQEIGFHRFVSVTIGVMWALFMSTFVLPQSARSRLKKGLSVLWLQLGILWNSDPLSYKLKNGDSPEFDMGPIAMSGSWEINQPNNNIINLISKHEYELTGIPNKFKIHELFSELEKLCSQAPMELRIKGPFRSQAYTKLLNASETIINSMENMHMMISKNSNLTRGKVYVLENIRSEREELEGRVLLNLYMVASAMKLGLPLPTKGVSTIHAKDRMLAKLAEVRRAQKSGENNIVNDNDFTLVYCYILVSSQITDEIDKIIEVVNELFERVTPEELNL